MPDENELFIDDSMAMKNDTFSNRDTDDNDMFDDDEVTARSSVIRNTFNYLDSVDISETASDEITLLTSSQMNASCTTNASQISAKNSTAHYDDPD